MRYFFHIGFKGTHYSGWQKHSGVSTVQQVIEFALERIFKVPTNIVGCGRTDAGVHAGQFFFHADLNELWDFDLLFRLNKVLPDDIAVFDIIPMDGLPHARFDAYQRSYDYFIHTVKDPYLTDISSFYALNSLDVSQINKAAEMLCEYEDYAAFCKSPNKNAHTICRVTFAKFSANQRGDRFHFQISANRFLGRMIRILIGKLIKIGEGSLSLHEFESYFIDNKPLMLEPAYPQGLHLSKVSYPFLDLCQRPDLMHKLE